MSTSSEHRPSGHDQEYVEPPPAKTLAELCAYRQAQRTRIYHQRGNGSGRLPPRHGAAVASQHHPRRLVVSHATGGGHSTDHRLRTERSTMRTTAGPPAERVPPQQLDKGAARQDARAAVVPDTVRLLREHYKPHRRRRDLLNKRQGASSSGVPTCSFVNPQAADDDGVFVKEPVRLLAETACRQQAHGGWAGDGGGVAVESAFSPLTRSRSVNDLQAGLGCVSSVRGRVLHYMLSSAPLRAAQQRLAFALVMRQYANSLLCHMSSPRQWWGRIPQRQRPTQPSARMSLKQLRLLKQEATLRSSSSSASSSQPTASAGGTATALPTTPKVVLRHRDTRRWWRYSAEIEGRLRRCRHDRAKNAAAASAPAHRGGGDGSRGSGGQQPRLGRASVSHDGSTPSPPRPPASSSSSSSAAAASSSSSSASTVSLSPSLQSALLSTVLSTATSSANHSHIRRERETVLRRLCVQSEDMEQATGCGWLDPGARPMVLEEEGEGEQMMAAGTGRDLSRHRCRRRLPRVAKEQLNDMRAWRAGMERRLKALSIAESMLLQGRGGDPAAVITQVHCAAQIMRMVGLKVVGDNSSSSPPPSGGGRAAGGASRGDVATETANAPCLLSRAQTYAPPDAAPSNAQPKIVSSPRSPPVAIPGTTLPE